MKCVRKFIIQPFLSAQLQSVDVGCVVGLNNKYISEGIEIRIRLLEIWGSLRIISSGIRTLKIKNVH